MTHSIFDTQQQTEVGQPARAPRERRGAAGARRALFLAWSALILVSAPQPARATEAPDRLRVGPHELVRCGSGTRSITLVELYTVDFYSPTADAGVSSLQDPDIPRALILRILFAGPLPDDIPPEWREEIVPALSKADRARLRDRLARMTSGDVLRVDYAPDGSSRVLANGEPILDGAGADLMNAFVDVWLGDDPVSPALKERLLR